MPAPTSKPTNVIFVRHAITPKTGIVNYGQAKGNHLAEFGLEQANRAAARVKKITGGRVAAIISSPLERASETAKPIARELNLRLKHDKRLLEIASGTDTNKKLAVIMGSKAGRHIQEDPATFRFPGGESFAEVYARLMDLISDVQENYKTKTVVVVTHGDLVKIAIAHAVGVGLSGFQNINVNPASVSIISYFDHRALLQCVNDTSHLEDMETK